MPFDDPFIASLDSFVAHARDRSDRVVRAIAEDCLARVKELTPVRTGYLRANWAIVIGNDPAAIMGARNDGSLQALLKIHAGVVFTLTNVTVYSRRVEEGFVGNDSAGRHYDQQGAHMLQQTITELPQIVAGAIARVNREAI